MDDNYLPSALPAPQHNVQDIGDKDKTKIAKDASLCYAENSVTQSESRRRINENTSRQ